jgi:very-long-chain (3R)-3-hydroxyacyl-CoA dehydratase
LVLTLSSIVKNYKTPASASGIFSKLLGTQSDPLTNAWDSLKGSYYQKDIAEYANLGWWVKWTQTLAILEVVHSALGLVKSPVGTVAAQVASRLWAIWGVVEAVPAVGYATRVVLIVGP